MRRTFDAAGAAAPSSGASSIGHGHSAERPSATGTESLRAHAFAGPTWVSTPRSIDACHGQGPSLGYAHIHAPGVRIVTDPLGTQTVSIPLWVALEGACWSVRNEIDERADMVMRGIFRRIAACPLTIA